MGAELSKYQQFEMARMARTELREHPKNPRVLLPAQGKRLKGKMKQVGLLQPIIWNKRSGFLLGGHQRLGVLDALEKFDPATGAHDYLLDVAVVDLEERRELEMLVFLNNASAQGVWETDLLASINLDSGVDFGSMGFDRIDVDLLFDGDARFSELFVDEAPEAKEAKGTLEKIKADRKASTEALKDGNTADFYFVVVCKDQAEKDETMKRLGVPVYEQFVSADAVLGCVPEVEE